MKDPAADWRHARSNFSPRRCARSTPPASRSCWSSKTSWTRWSLRTAPTWSIMAAWRNRAPPQASPAIPRSAKPTWDCP